jgi:putative transposase
MWVNQAFRFELSPNKEQRKALAQHIGAARFAYNWGLEMALRALEEARRIPSAPELHKAWNVWKRENAPWWTEVSKCAPQEAFRDLERALRNWQKRKGRFPRFKRKKLTPDNGARLTGAIRVFSRHIGLPRIGKVKSKEPTDKLLKLLEEGKAKILSATVSREADRFYVSLTCEVERPEPKPKEVKRRR